MFRASMLAAVVVGSILFCPALASEGPAHLVADIRAVPDPAGSNPFTWGEAAGVVYFGAATEGSGYALWRTDGTEVGTWLVEDTSPNSTANIGVLVGPEMEGVLYFTDALNSHLWRSGGTPETTYPIAPADNDGTMEVQDRPIVVGGQLLYAARDALHGSELWRSDGTESGTRLARDIRPGPGSSSGSTFTSSLRLFAFGDRAVFCADDGEHGAEPWISNGTEEGTRLLRDIHPVGSNLDDCIRMTVAVVGERAFFLANDGVHGTELWATDGSEAGTVLVTDLRPGPLGSGIGGMVSFGSFLLFASTGFGTSEPARLWRSDGTEEGTHPIGNIAAADLVAAQGQVFFRGFDPALGSELWRTDGTAEGTFLVRELAPGPETPFIGPMNVLGSAIIFPLTLAPHGRELWRSDGTSEGTYLLRDIRPGTANSFPLLGPHATAGAVYFSADDGVHGRELWRTDGTPEGTLLVKDIRKTAGSRPELLTDVSGTVMFTADDGTHGPELWKSAGSTASTQMVAELFPGSANQSFAFQDFTSSLGKLFFSLNDDDGSGLWRPWVSDGSVEGTLLLADLPGEFLSFVPVDRGVVFLGRDPDSGAEPWSSDGTVEGTGLVRDLVPGPEPRSGIRVATLGTQALIWPVLSGQLWRTDGTSAGTEFVEQIYAPLFGASHLTDIVSDGEATYFMVMTPFSQLWRTDGTAEGTFPLQLLDPVWPHGGGRLFGAENRIFAFLKDDPGTYDLYATDTDGQTLVPVREDVGTTDRPPGPAVAVGSMLYYAARDPALGYELWKSDGTAEGTSPVRDIAPGIADSMPAALTEVDGVLLFAASDGLHGVEVWRSDGTPEGTVRVQDISPGPASSTPAGFRRSGARLYFSADDGIHGEELWSAWAAIATAQPARAVQDLRNEVLALHLPQGRENGLLAKLDAAAAAIAAGSSSDAIGPLRGFLRSLAALRSEPTDELAELAEQTIGLLKGGTPQPDARAARTTAPSGGKRLASGP